MISACEILGRGLLLLEKNVKRGRVAEEEVYEYYSVNAMWVSCSIMYHS